MKKSKGYKVVLNSCFGGFSLSKDAIQMLIDKHGLDIKILFKLNVFTLEYNDKRDSVNLINPPYTDLTSCIPKDVMAVATRLLSIPFIMKGSLLTNSPVFS